MPNAYSIRRVDTSPNPHAQGPTLRDPSEGMTERCFLCEELWPIGSLDIHNGVRFCLHCAKKLGHVVPASRYTTITPTERQMHGVVIAPFGVGETRRSTLADSEAARLPPVNRPFPDRRQISNRNDDNPTGSTRI